MGHNDKTITKKFKVFKLGMNEEIKLEDITFISLSLIVYLLYFPDIVNHNLSSPISNVNS